METAAVSQEVISSSLNLSKKQFCSFWLSGRLFGIDILDVKEISQELEFTQIFHSQKGMKGYVNIRGQIYLILDLRLLLGFESEEVAERNRIILFKISVAEASGILVDEIGNIVEVSEKQIEDYSDGAANSSHLIEEESNIGEFVAGICKLENNLMVVLDVRKIFEAKV